MLAVVVFDDDGISLCVNCDCRILLAVNCNNTAALFGHVISDFAAHEVRNHALLIDFNNSELLAGEVEFSVDSGGLDKRHIDGDGPCACAFGRISLAVVAGLVGEGNFVVRLGVVHEAVVCGSVNSQGFRNAVAVSEVIVEGISDLVEVVELGVAVVVKSGKSLEAVEFALGFIVLVTVHEHDAGSLLSAFDENGVTVIKREEVFVEGEVFSSGDTVIENPRISTGTCGVFVAVELVSEETVCTDILEVVFDLSFELSISFRRNLRLDSSEILHPTSAEIVHAAFGKVDPAFCGCDIVLTVLVVEGNLSGESACVAVGESQSVEINIIEVNNIGVLDSVGCSVESVVVSPHSGQSVGELTVVERKDCEALGAEAESTLCSVVGSLSCSPSRIGLVLSTGDSAHVGINIVVGAVEFNDSNMVVPEALSLFAEEAADREAVLRKRHGVKSCAVRNRLGVDNNHRGLAGADLCEVSEVVDIAYGRIVSCHVLGHVSVADSDEEVVVLLITGLHHEVIVSVCVSVVVKVNSFTESNRADEVIECLLSSGSLVACSIGVILDSKVAVLVNAESASATCGLGYRNCIVSAEVLVILEVLCGPPGAYIVAVGILSKEHCGIVTAVIDIGAVCGDNEVAVSVCLEFGCEDEGTFRVELEGYLVTLDSLVENDVIGNEGVVGIGFAVESADTLSIACFVGDININVVRILDTPAYETAEDCLEACDIIASEKLEGDFVCGVSTVNRSIRAVMVLQSDGEVLGSITAVDSAVIIDTVVEATAHCDAAEGSDSGVDNSINIRADTFNVIVNISDDVLLQLFICGVSNSCELVCRVLCIDCTISDVRSSILRIVVACNEAAGSDLATRIIDDVLVAVNFGVEAVGNSIVKSICGELELSNGNLYCSDVEILAEEVRMFNLCSVAADSSP